MVVHNSFSVRLWKNWPLLWSGKDANWKQLINKIREKYSEFSEFEKQTHPDIESKNYGISKAQYLSYVISKLAPEVKG